MKSHHRAHALLALIALALARSLFAAPLHDTDNAIELDPVVVTATRTERSLFDTPATVSVVELDRDPVSNFGYLVRKEPLVSAPFRAFGADAFVPYQRGGYTSYNIRGIEGNRVLLQIDGVRLPDEFSLNGTEPTGRDYFDVDGFKRVEILHGSASALFGSDALGGAFTFQTKDPADYLGRTDRSYYFAYKAAYATVNDSRSHTATAAAQVGPLAALAVFTRRAGHETENKGTVSANPEEFTQQNLLAKLVWVPSPAHRLTAALEYFQRQQDIDIDNAEGNQGFAGTIARVFTRSDTERFRLGLDYAFTPATPTAALDRLDAKIYTQDAVSRDANQQVRTLPSPRTRDTVTAFHNDTTGGSVFAQKTLTQSNIRHRLLYGVDQSRTKTSKPFRRLQTTTVASLTDAPRMADTTTERTGFFLQDEIDLRLGDAKTGRKLAFIPGLRVERFQLTPDNSPAYLATTAGQPAPSFDKTAVTPKLGLVVGLTAKFNAYASYNRGYRYPNAEDLTATFTNVAIGYKTIPNPALRAETSDSFEAGVKGRIGAALTLRATVFHNTYKDFISPFELTAITDPAFPVGIFQTRNIADARISGYDISARLTLGEINSTLAGWSLAIALGRSKGDGRLAPGAPRTPLNSIEPLKANATLSYDPPKGRWGAALSADHAQGKRTNALHQPSTALFRPPSYTVLDLAAYWRINEHVSLNLGLYNLTDLKYWRYSAIRGIAAASISQQERRTEPGFNAAVSAQVSF